MREIRPAVKETFQKQWWSWWRGVRVLQPGSDEMSMIKRKKILNTSSIFCEKTTLVFCVKKTIFWCNSAPANRERERLKNKKNKKKNTLLQYCWLDSCYNSCTTGCFSLLLFFFFFFFLSPFFLQFLKSIHVWMSPGVHLFLLLPAFSRNRDEHDKQHLVTASVLFFLQGHIFSPSETLLSLLIPHNDLS